jgi:glycosyltransferase involved in cell wall biosynthesis
MWSHVSGFYPPNVFTDALLKYPDIFVFTTPMSENTLEAKRASGDLRVIWSTAGTDHVKDVRPKPHKGFIVGYIGTVDYCKMHPDFLKMSMSVKVPGVHFIVCGGPNDEQMREEAERLGVGDKFTFTGPVDDIAPYLSEFDVFGYPLNPMHYGTCDQSLAEAMAAGVPPVTLGNPMERYMVDAHGYVVEEENYAAAIELLHLNPFLRRDLSGYLREAAAQRFSLDAMIEQWQHVFEDLMKKPKSERKWSGRVSGEGVSPSEVFIESLGDHVDDFRANLKGTPSFNWKSKTRGTAHQYSSFSPQDKILREWSDSMEVA